MDGRSQETRGVESKPRGRIVKALMVLILGGVSGSNAVASPITIMPLGDSITYGVSSPTSVPGSYRGVLYRDLTSAGYNVEFVGSLTNNPDPTLPAAAQSHEGHPGFQIAGTPPFDSFSINTPNGIDKWLAPGNGVNPKLILLEAGSNEIIGNYHSVSAPQELAALVTKIHELRPNSMVLISTLTPLTGVPRQAQVDAFNRALSGPSGIVAQLQQLGQKVALVNAGGTLTLDDIGMDGAHPNQQGYLKLGNAWAVGVEAALSVPGVAPEPSTLAVLGCGFLALISVARANRKATKPVQSRSG